MTKFIDFEDVLKSFSPEDQAEIEEDTRAMILSREMSRLKGRGVKQMACDLKSFGATLFIRMPNGKEVELPLPGVAA